MDLCSLEPIHDPELFVLLNEYQRSYVLTWGLDRTGLQPTIGHGPDGCPREER
jgi:hypothetical protein